MVGPPPKDQKSSDAQHPRRSKVRSLRGLAAGRVPSDDLFLPDPPDNPKRIHKTSRCWFRGGHIDPVSLDRDFLRIAQRAAPVVTQIPGASADDFLELLRSRSEYSTGLRIDSPHLAAADYCGRLRDLLAAAVYRGLDGYPELRKFNPNKEGKLSKRGIALQVKLERFEADFRELAVKDQLAHEAEVVRQNDAHAAGLPIEKGRHGYSVEFPELIPIQKAQLLVVSRGLVAALSSKGRGRPAAQRVDGEKVKELRGDASQAAFSKRTKLSIDVIQRAERGEATGRTVRRLRKYAKDKGLAWTPDDPKKHTAKSRGN